MPRMLTVEPRGRELTARVLIVEDDPDALATLGGQLATLPHTWDVSGTTDPGRALAEMAANPVDVIVTDHRLLLADGTALLDAVRERFPKTARLIASEAPLEGDLLKTLHVAHQFLIVPCRPEALAEAIARALWMRDQLANAKVNTAGLTRLPVLPSTSAEVLRELDRPSSTGRSLARVIQHDPGLSAKVLQLVNSAYYGLDHATTDLTDAVTKLGMSTVRSMVLMDDAFKAFQLPPQFSTHWLQDIAAHSLETARLARWLAAETPFAEDAFCAGVLHEVGQLVIAACRPEAYALLRDVWSESDEPLSTVEMATFGIDHGGAGAHLLALWGLPQPVIDAVARHNDHAVFEGPPSAARYLAAAHAVVEASHSHMCERLARSDDELDAMLGTELRRSAAQWLLFQTKG